MYVYNTLRGIHINLKQQTLWLVYGVNTPFRDKTLTTWWYIPVLQIA